MVFSVCPLQINLLWTFMNFISFYFILLLVFISLEKYSKMLKLGYAVDFCLIYHKIVILLSSVQWLLHSPGRNKGIDFVTALCSYRTLPPLSCSIVTPYSYWSLSDSQIGPHLLSSPLYSIIPYYFLHWFPFLSSFFSQSAFYL